MVIKCELKQGKDEYSDPAWLSAALNIFSVRM